MRVRSPRGSALLLLVVFALQAAPAAAQIRARAAVRPGVARLGQRVVYRGQVIAPSGANFRWLPPEPAETFAWGTPRVGRNAGTGGRDTTWIEIPLQVFDVGTVSIPGVRFAARAGGTMHRLPVARLLVDPLIAPNDTTSNLRELRAVTAPWWERVPWTWVVVGLLLVAAAIALWMLRRRRRPAVAAPVAAPAPVRRDPAAEALAALAELRAEGLPARGLFAEHAFRLGQILRRYLEATMGTTRPGDTTPELVAHLRDAGLDAAQLQRLSGLLRTWDRIKFAREPFTADEAVRSEEAVESFVTRPSRAPAAEVA
jgi:hypothetical protein